MVAPSWSVRSQSSPQTDSRECTDSCRVVWAESDSVYDADSERDKLYFADGVHKTAAGPPALRRALLPHFVAPDGPLGSRLKPSIPVA